jgi:1,4-dihydroxy-2-naphthoyl-CoA synthase
MFEQAILPIEDRTTFATVRSSLDKAFAPARVQEFLRSLVRARLRARQFEAILASGLLGKEAPAAYAALGDSDRGHVREQYLSMVEQVAPELRAKFLKVYAYY